ncbi:hypothetical protein GQ42DRAFT_152459 [Ramicandelaber brevisporus]|nr:hypothetical protein GQ42DRAFT_152459 [Ramicandelaber brevisporus]
MSSGFDYTFGLAGVLARIEKYRERLNLPQPGTIETASREARGVIGSHLFFDGGRADLAKLLSPNFQETGKPEAVCSVGGKYDLRGATIRSSFDTRGKVRMMMEEKVYPGILLSLNGEIDHVKGINRFGIGLSMEG